MVCGGQRARLLTVLFGIALLAGLSTLPSGAAGCSCRSSASSPVWSPDGASILYTSVSPEGESFVTEASIASAEPTVPLRVIGGLSPVFSRDGRRLATFTPKPAGVWVSDVGATDARQVNGTTVPAAARSQRL